MNLARKWTETSLIARIIAGLTVGVVLGLVCPSQKWIGLFGTIFVGALKAIAPVLVALLVMSSVAKSRPGTGKRFRRVILLYICSTMLAAIVAVCGSFMFPVNITLDTMAAEGTAAPGSLSEVFATILSNIVANPVNSVAQANYIGIIFWSVIIGFALKLAGATKAVDIVLGFSDAVSMVVKWIIQFAPIGILGLIFSSISENGLGIFSEYGELILLLVACMLSTALIVNPLISWIFTRKNPYPLVFKCLKGSGVPAFFTRSSAANIPVNMQLCNDLGLDKDFYSVSIPLGATINMNGAAATITVLSLAVCNTLGIEVSFSSAIVLCILSTLGACGASGVAGGSLLLVPMACSLFGVPDEIAMQAVSVGFIIGVIQDSVETALNSSSDVLFTATAEMSLNG